MNHPPHPLGQVLDAHLHVLDRQVLDRDGMPVTTADDLELEGIELGRPIEPGAPPPFVSAILEVTGSTSASAVLSGNGIAPPSRIRFTPGSRNSTGDGKSHT